jgi:aminoglycoside phosphotransferase (APT) family kinase protein
MVAAMSKRPWTISRQGRVLAELHHRLHHLAAPDWLPDAPVGEGDRLLHLDLHPLNVMLSPKGPVVIDWTSACRGDPAVDVALAWVLMTAGSVPTGHLIGTVLARARSVLVTSFLRSFDLEAIGRSLHDVVAWKVLDPHMSASEQARMWTVVEEFGG